MRGTIKDIQGNRSCRKTLYSRSIYEQKEKKAACAKDNILSGIFHANRRTSFIGIVYLPFDFESEVLKAGD